MNVSIKPLLLIFFSGLIFSTCKDSESPDPLSPNNGRELRAELASKPETFTIDPTSASSFRTTTGIKFDIPANCLMDASGNPPAGQVKFEIISMLNLKDMILNSCPTITKDGLFFSGGEFFISATSNGKTLQPNLTKKWITVEMPGEILGSATLGLPIWKGEKVPVIYPDRDISGNVSIRPGPQTTINWTWVAPIATDTLSINGPQTSNSLSNFIPGNMGPLDSTGANYGNHYFSLTQFNFINLDIFYLYGTGTGANITLPTGYTNANSVCWLAFPGINSAAELGNFLNNSNSFNLEPYQIPIGLKVKAVIISKLGNQRKMAVKEVTVTDQMVLPFQESDFTSVTVEEIKTKLGQL
jgi:hypothetical protein